MKSFFPILLCVLLFNCFPLESVYAKNREENLKKSDWNLNDARVETGRASSIGDSLASVEKKHKFNNLFYNLSFGGGYVMGTNDFLKGVNRQGKKISSLASVSLKVGRQTDNSKPWHALYNDFRYGVGFFHGVFNNSKDLGNPFALYAFAGFSPIKYKRFTFKNELAFGLSGVWDCYDKDDNNQNIAVSMPIEVYIHFDFEGFWKLDDKWQINAGVSLMHFSNGALTKPNKGINVVNGQLGISYCPSKIERLPNVYSEPKEKRFHLDAGAWAGVHAVYFDCKDLPGRDDTVQKSYWVEGLQLKMMYDISSRYELGVGVEGLYNDALWKNDAKRYFAKDYKKLGTADKLGLGIYLSFHYNVNNFAVLVEPGYAIRQKHGYAPKFYQRLGLRYYAFKGMFAQLALRAYNYHVADYIEWGIGYRFNR